MSDDDADEPPEAVERVDDGDAGASADRDAGFEVDTRARTLLRWGALAGLGLLGLVATFGLYTSVQAIIRVWVADAYQPFFEAAFNLVVLLVVAVAAARLVDWPGSAE